MNQKTIIASIAHAINAAYCASLGDTSQPAWADAPEWQQKSALAGVEMHLANPDATPEQSHESWLAQKLAEGWTYGPEKNVETKQHPCCVPYDQLPQEQKAKDYLFRAVVHALKDLPLVQQAAQVEQGDVAPAKSAKASMTDMVRVRYIARRPNWKDDIYGSGLSFTTGQERTVPISLARSFLRHGDMFEQVQATIAVDAHADVQATGDDAGALEQTDDTAETLAKRESEEKAAREKALDLSALHRDVDNMDFATLTEFAARYGAKLTKQQGLVKGRAEVHGLIDQFGAV